MSENAARCTWATKVRHVSGSRTLSAIEREAGWAVNSLASAMNQSRSVGVEKALSLARALHVPVEWLFDDTKDITELPAARMQGEINSTALVRDIATLLNVYAQSLEDQTFDIRDELRVRLPLLARGDRPSANDEAAL